MIIATLLPLARLDDWWVRIFDFPRLQIAAVSIAVLLGVIAMMLHQGTATTLQALWLCVLAACTAYQGWRMFPYTRLHRQQVQDSDGADADQRLSVLCANVLMTNRDAGGLLRLVEQCDPDLVLAAEADDWWQQALAPVGATRPYQVLQPQGNTYGMLLYSKLELREAQVRFLVEDDVPSIHAMLRLRSGQEVVLRCLHPRPPAPGESDSSAERDAELLLVGKEIKALAQPAVVCGDMNDVAWSRTNDLFCAVGGLLDPRIGRGFFHTFNAKWPLIRFPLDHVFHTPHFRLAAFRRLPHWGSDHYPVFIELSFEPEAKAAHETPQASAGEEAEAGEKISKAS